MLDLAELVSLCLTPPTVLLAALVVWKYSPSIIDVRTNRSDITKLRAGIAIGFIGSIVDNLYWGIAWSAEFFHLDSTAFWFAHGAYSNAIFRQSFGIIAAMLHIWSAFHLLSTRIRLVRMLIGISLALGILLIAAKWYAMGGSELTPSAIVKAVLK